MRNMLVISHVRRPTAVVAVGLIIQVLLTPMLLSGCSLPQPTQLRIVRTIGTRDQAFIDRPLAVAATSSGAMLVALRADGQAEVIRLDGDRARVDSSLLAGQFGTSPHEFGLLPDGRLAVRTRADKVQLFSRGKTGVYAVSSTVPAGGPLVAAPDGTLYIAVDSAIRRYSGDGTMIAAWTAPGKPVALAWNPSLKRVCAFLPTIGPEQLRLTERSPVYAAPSYGSERLGAVDRGATVTVQNGSAPMNDFIRISTPFAGFVPVTAVASIIGTLCQYTSEGGTGSLLTVSCGYAPASTADRRAVGVAVSQDGLVFVLIRQRESVGDRLLLVAVDESGFGSVRGGTPAMPSTRRPLRASIADTRAAGVACTNTDVLVADGRQLWRGPIWGSGLAVVQPPTPATGTLREPLALAISSGEPDTIAVLDWLRADVQQWSADSSPAILPVPVKPGETAIDVLAEEPGHAWLAVAGVKSARVVALEAAETYEVSATLAESLGLSAWWLEPDADRDAPPRIIAGWGERQLSYIKGTWAADAGSYAYPWQHYLPGSGAEMAAYLRRAGVLPKGTRAAPPDWIPLIRGMTKGPDGRVYIATGRTPTYAMRIFVFTADGLLEAQYRLPPEVGLPSDIAVDRAGHIWLTDPEHYRVVELVAES